MELRVLGPVEVAGEDGAVRLPGIKHRRLLATLLVHAGASTAADILIEALWPAARPASAAKLVQVYVSQLRKVLPDGLSVETRGGGYSLVFDPGSLDAVRFERSLDEAIASRHGGNPELALALLDRALAIWRGAAYGEFAYEDFAHSEVERLEELRLVATEERFAAALDLGRHADVLPELRGVAGEHPLRERLQAQTMLALYRCGRQTEALEVYAATRARLRDELGLDPGSELRALQRRILEQDESLAAVRATPDRQAELPVPPNPLLGRGRELADLRALLTREEVRLLTLTGAGGSGKTRLALGAAHELASSFANGAAFVALAPLRDPELILGAIVRVLPIEQAEAGGQEPLETLAHFLRDRELLLVLDNAEHLRDAMHVLSDLLARTPRLTLLVTSRTVLHLSGEHVYPVQPLPPQPARELFHARARQADAHFESDRSVDEVVEAICARLDGLPLAIELAAGRTPTLPPADILARLDARLPLLVGGPRDLPARQQTLRATLEWSFELLTPTERALGRRLAVFAGSFDLDAAREVCDADPEALGSLVEHSLLQRGTDGLFSYLETIREYALERLIDAADVDEIRRRHCRYFLQIAQAADLSAARRRGGERLDVADAARDNLRAALAWSLETGSIAIGLELASAIERYWVTHAPREGMAWFERLLSHPEAAAVDPALRAEALRAYGGATDIAGDDEAARRIYEQSLALFEQLGDEHGCAVLLHRLGISAMRRGDLDAARGLVEASDKIHRGAGDRWGQAQTIGTLGAIARDSGDRARAVSLLESSAALAREVGVRWWESGMLAELAALAVQGGEIDAAEGYARDSLTVAEAIGDRPGRIFGVGLFAVIAAARGRRERARELWAVVDGENAVAPLGGWRRHKPEIRARVEEWVGDITPVGEEAGLSLEEAVGRALRLSPRRRANDLNRT